MEVFFLTNTTSVRYQIFNDTRYLWAGIKTNPSLLHIFVNPYDSTTGGTSLTFSPIFNMSSNNNFSHFGPITRTEPDFFKGMVVYIHTHDTTGSDLFIRFKWS